MPESAESAPEEPPKPKPKPKRKPKAAAKPQSPEESNDSDDGKPLGRKPKPSAESAPEEPPKPEPKRKPKAAAKRQSPEESDDSQADMPLGRKTTKKAKLSTAAPAAAAPEVQSTASPAKSPASGPRSTSPKPKKAPAARQPTKVARIVVLPPKCTSEQAEVMIALMEGIKNAPLFVAVPQGTSLPPNIGAHTPVTFIAVTNSGVPRPCLRRIIEGAATALGATKPADLLCAVAYTDAATDADLPTRKNVQLIHPALAEQYGLDAAAPKLATFATSQAYHSLLADAPPVAAESAPAPDLSAECLGRDVPAPGSAADPFCLSDDSDSDDEGCQYVSG
jgi:hypothetical protein